MEDLNKFYEWVAADPNHRSISIEIRKGGLFDKDSLVTVKVWAYDYSLGVGQHVQAVAEIDLEGEKERADLEKLAELQAKYGAKV